MITATTHTAAVWVDPGRHSGAPCVFGTRIPTDLVASIYWESGIDTLESGYDLTREQIIGAIWFEATYGNRTMRRRYGDWAKDEHAQLSAPTHYGKPALPPTKEYE